MPPVGTSKEIEGRSGTTDLIRNSKIALEGHREVMHSHPGYRWKSFGPRTSAGLLSEFHPCARSRLRTQSPPLCLKVRVWVFKPLRTPVRGRESPLVWQRSRGLVWARRKLPSNPLTQQVHVNGQNVPLAALQTESWKDGSGRKEAIHEPCLFFISAQSQVIAKLGSTPRQRTQTSLSVAAWWFVLTLGPWPLHGDSPWCHVFSHLQIRWSMMPASSPLSAWLT